MALSARVRTLIIAVTVTVAVLAAIVVAYGMAARSVISGIDAMCANQIIRVYPSPDERRKVVVFQRDCGATSAYSTQASVLDANAEMPTESGNVFIARVGRATSGPGGGPELRVRWLDERHLVLSHHEGVAMLSAAHEHNDVTLTYETFR